LLNTIDASPAPKIFSPPEMNTYYLSFRCKPSGTDPHQARYSGMLADLFVAAESEDGVEQIAERHLASAGWAIDELEYAEQVDMPSSHDSRFAELFRKSQTNGVASIFSPF
jgi:hypothetical protein